MANLSWVDYIFLAIFFFSILSGFARGFVREVIGLGALIAAFVLAALFAQPLAEYFTSSAPVQGVVNQASSAIGVSAAKPVTYMAIGVSFSVVFAATLLVGALFGYLMNAIFQTGILGLGNRLLGGLFGLGRGFLLNLVLIFIVQLPPIGAQAMWQQSEVVIWYQPWVQWLGGIVSPTLATLKNKLGNSVQDVGSSIQNMTNSIGQ
jgi:membrane protein required for colicin V production